MEASTEAGCGLHTSIVDEVLEQTGENEFVRIEDAVNLLHLDSQVEEVVCTRDGSMERTGSRVSRFIDLEEFLARVREEKAGGCYSE